MKTCEYYKQFYRFEVEKSKKLNIGVWVKNLVHRMDK